MIWIDFGLTVQFERENARRLLPRSRSLAVQEYAWLIQYKEGLGNDPEILNKEEGRRFESFNEQVSELQDHIIQPHQLHAVIIGIDKYLSHSISPMKGAVSDARAMEEYLVTKMGVLSSHILTLRDQEATREAIITVLRNIGDHPNIGRGDPILIYFAGHGTTVAVPPGWESANSKVPVLVPYDYGSGVEGATVSGIPDRTIAILLDEIAETKGNNIVSLQYQFEQTHIHTLQTLILDCPHSGGYFQGGTRSHVLLAACGAEEMAMEENDRGIFTTALIQKLEANGANRVSYAELIHQIGSLSGYASYSS